MVFSAINFIEGDFVADNFAAGNFTAENFASGNLGTRNLFREYVLGWNIILVLPKKGGPFSSIPVL